eukprot:8152151-Karenia_brevis.AAC.1
MLPDADDEWGLQRTCGYGAMSLMGSYIEVYFLFAQHTVLPDPSMECQRFQPTARATRDA